jgi:2-alkenal reductase
MNSLPKAHSWKKFWLFILVPILALACGISTPLSRTVPQVVQTAVPVITQLVSTPAPITLPAPITDEQSLLVSLYTRVNPSVVNITTYAQQNGTMQRLAQGSGFVYDNDRHIATNAHVIQDAEQIEVTFSDGTITPAKLVGQDSNSDLAILQVDEIPGGVEPLSLGDMSQLAVGQTVIAIGNPFGLNGTLTRGVISALGRDIPDLTQQYSIPQAIQTDAAINPGNSGGPLLNLEGQVIGINAQIETGGTGRANTGVGFAIPVSILKRVLPDLASKGSTEWAWLGVRGGSLNPTLVEAMNLPVDKGAYLVEIISGGPAEKAGLRGASQTVTVNDRDVDVGGDVIIAIDGQPVNSFDDILVYIALQTYPGQEAKLTVIRNGKSQDVTLILGTRPAELPTPTLP